MNKILVAKIGRTVGLKGFLKLHIISDFLEQFKDNAKFLGDEQDFIIKSFDSEKNLVLFKGYESLELAKTLVNKLLYKSEEESRKTCELKEGEFFYFDIISCELFEDGLKLGKVVDILETSANYLFLVRVDEALRPEFASEFYLPYADFYIDKVDIAAKKIHTKNALELLKSL